jgi:hypothetical protein
MAHFAKIDENNIVTEILVVSEDDIQNLSFPESEPIGAAFLNSFLPPATWKQTCKDGTYRFKYAGIGDEFHPECGEHGGFSTIKRVDDFIWDASICGYKPPIPYPTDGHDYYWNFYRKQWSPVTQDPPQTTFIG